MKIEAFEAHGSCGHFAPKIINKYSVFKKLFPKNIGVGLKFVNTVYKTFSYTLVLQTPV